MHSNRQPRKDHLFIIAVISTFIVLSSTINDYGYNSVTNIVYVQADSNQTNSRNASNLENIQDITLEKVHVGDIDIAY